MTFAQAIEIGREKIGQRDAMLLLSHVTNQTSGYIMLHEDASLDVAAKASYMNGLARRQAGEPLQHIIGSWDFMGQVIKTDHRALIPRPETERLVEETFSFICGCKSPVHVIDLCTGSGCIAVALVCLAATEGIDLEIFAVDKSTDALELAKENAKHLGYDKKIKFIESDLFEAMHDFLSFDIIVSNPPYIPTAEIPTLEPVVRDYDPRMALDGGIDGMDFYRRIIPQSIEFLRPGGALFLEIGPTAVDGILSAVGFEDVQLINDYAGLPRILRGLKPKGVTNNV